MRIASALTKPTMTERGMNRISRATPSTPRTTCKIPARMTVAMKYSKPWSRITGAMTSATAPVAAEIIAGRPPRKAIETAIVNEANSPTRGSTPAMIEKLIASGISASATTRPPSTSIRSRRGERSAARTDVMSASSAAGEWAGSGVADSGASEVIRSPDKTERAYPSLRACTARHCAGGSTRRSRHRRGGAGEEHQNASRTQLYPNVRVELSSRSVILPGPTTPTVGT